MKVNIDYTEWEKNEAWMKQSTQKGALAWLYENDIEYILTIAKRVDKEWYTRVIFKDPDDMLIFGLKWI